MDTCGTLLAIDTPSVSIHDAYITLLYAIRNSNGLSFTLPWNSLNYLNFSSPFNLESGNGKKSINNLLQGAHWYETAPIDSKRTLVEWWNGSQLSTERGDLLNFGYWVLRFDKVANTKVHSFCKQAQGSSLIKIFWCFPTTLVKHFPDLLLMSALASLEKFGEEDLVFINWRSCRHCLQSEWPLVSDLFTFECPHDIQ